MCDCNYDHLDLTSLENFFISFLNTPNLFIESRISQIGKWEKYLLTVTCRESAEHKRVSPGVYIRKGRDNNITVTTTGSCDRFLEKKGKFSHTSIDDRIKINERDNKELKIIVDNIIMLAELK